MRGFVFGLAAMAILLCPLPQGAVATGAMVKLAQNAFGTDQGETAPSPPTSSDGPASPANSPELIRRAQIELKRLDCLSGRVDGRLGNQTHQAIKKFWASAKQPDGEVNVTEELIAALKERGDNYCRPPRPFFAIGARSGGNFVLPFLAPGVRPALPGTAMPSAPPAGEH
jgi:peptidoglycan hydrolase-like protein with peptidoglycan-binding domain